MSQSSRIDDQARQPKQFFASMHTRGISHDDATLCLLADCLDSAMRIPGGDSAHYAKHCVRIELGRDDVSIEDDCGGIPSEVAINDAFRLGREPDDDHDSESETACQEVSCHLPELIRLLCGEGRAAVVMAWSHGSTGYAEYLSQGAFALFDGFEAEMRASRDKAATPKRMASQGCSE